MKKNNTGFIVAFFIIGLILISATISPNKNEKSTTTNDTQSSEESVLDIAQKESDKITESEMKDFININVETYLEYYKASKKRIVLMARPTCQYCQIAEPILQKIAKDYKLDIYYLNTSEVVVEDQERLLNSNEIFQNGFGTPFLVIVQNSKIVDYVDGLTDTTHYLQTFKNSGLI